MDSCFLGYMPLVYLLYTSTDSLSGRQSTVLWSLQNLFVCPKPSDQTADSYSRLGHIIDGYIFFIFEADLYLPVLGNKTVGIIVDHILI